ncbi:hypothetical protein ACWEV3_37325 [Saccharopolyspora sp. NPDC003752]
MATPRSLALGLLGLAGITQITCTPQRVAADRTRILPHSGHDQPEPASTIPAS